MSCHCTCRWSPRPSRVAFLGLLGGAAFAAATVICIYVWVIVLGLE